MAAWTRKQIEADLAAAMIISAGGFSPERWDTEPPGQVNPEDIPQSDAVTAALGCDTDAICGWVQVVAYGKLNNEPDEEYRRDSTGPVALIDNGRREVEHIIRHDPRSVVADCEAKLAILDEHKGVASEYGGHGFKSGEMACDSCGTDDSWYGVAYPCRTVRLVAAGYRHRSGYQEAWKPDNAG